jgi:dihydrolipoamide dehydrogenase
MHETTVDVAVIGAGTAGLGARRAAEKAGAHAVAIDPGPLGTLCARVGCMPSKLLIAAGEAAHAVREAAGFGVHAEEPRIDAAEVFGRVRRERDRFVGFILDDCRALEQRGALLRGRARFVAPGVLQVDDDRRVIARRGVVIASGSAARVPSLFHGVADDPRVIGSDDVFELDAVPASVLVAGSGPIGIELGQALARLGARVTVVGVRGGLGGLSDPDVRASAKAALATELEIHIKYELHAVEARADGIFARFTGDDGQVREGTWSKVLLATGRKPRLSGLGLENSGIELDGEGRPARFDAATLQCGPAAVFLAGDVSDQRPLLHEAADDGQIAGRNAARFPDVAPGQRRAPLAITFTDPQIATVGREFSELDFSKTHAFGQVDFGNQGRARVMRKNRGLLRVYGERATGLLVGAELCGPAAEHLGHLLAWAVQQGLTVEQTLAMPFYHPVVEEGLRTALQQLRAAIQG